MTRVRLIFWTVITLLVLVIVGLAVVKTRATRPSLRAEALEPGDQEIAWFHVTTAFTNWERFVTGVQHFGATHDGWTIDDGNAFPDRSTDTPVVALRRNGSTQRLLIRWYKQSSHAEIRDWLRVLAARGKPPLAVIGGGSTDRAIELAEALKDAEDTWSGTAPLLFLTTATANRHITSLKAANEARDVMEYYPGRTFRACFTNAQMAEAVMSFVWSREDLRPFRNSTSDPRPSLTALEWGDDPYSVDLVEQFWEVASQAQEAPWKAAGGLLFQQVPIASSVGGFSRPNQWEANAVARLLSDPPVMELERSLANPTRERNLLLVPTVPNPARRLLISLCGAEPRLSRHLVVISGDGISFNNVYRDGDLIWNVRQMPVPLVFFTHQNPVEWAADRPPPASQREKGKLYGPHGSDDVRLMSDLSGVLAEAAFDVRSPSSFAQNLATDADIFRERLVCREPPFFEMSGNRRSGRGEFVVCLRPMFDAARPGILATLEVWTRVADKWTLVRRLELSQSQRHEH